MRELSKDCFYCGQTDTILGLIIYSDIKSTDSLVLRKCKWTLTVSSVDYSSDCFTH